MAKSVPAESGGQACELITPISPLLRIFENLQIKRLKIALTSVAQWVGHHLPGKAIGHWFNSQSGHILGLWVQSPVGVHTRGN